MDRTREDLNDYNINKMADRTRKENKMAHTATTTTTKAFYGSLQP